MIFLYPRGLVILPVDYRVHENEMMKNRHNQPPDPSLNTKLKEKTVKTAHHAK